ncbi:hypothetical protein TWF281_008608 [Arthrobotrys megalospora]
MNRYSRPVTRLSAAIRYASRATRTYTDSSPESSTDNSSEKVETPKQKKRVKPASGPGDASESNKIKIKGHSLLQGARLRRSFLYVPAHKERFINKALTSAADCIVLDLEDGVAPSQRATARENIKNLLHRLDKEGYKVGENQRAELCIRVNHEGWLGSKHWAYRSDKDSVAPSQELDQDLELLAVPGSVKFPVTVVLPKTNTPYDLRNIRAVVMKKRQKLGRLGHDITRLAMIPTIETALAIMNLPRFSTHTKFFSAMVFAAEDYCASLGIPRTKDHSNMLLARSSIVTLCKMAGIPPIDMVCQDFRDLEVLKRECEEGVYLGFEGKQAIHPDQIDTINKVFSLSAEEVEWATALLEAVKKNDADGTGAFEFEGKMVDRPVFRKAENILEKHRLIEEFEKDRFVTKVGF